MNRPPIVCPACGTPHDRDTTCPTCPPPPPRPRDYRAETARHGTRHERGYDNAWAKLSAQARARQPFCSDCGTTKNLTVDHSPEAWERRAAGKPIRLQDVDVTCTACNNRRGPARGPRATPRPTIGTAQDALQQLQNPLRPGGEGH